ncbi:hypothetical protein [Patulibacter minatonensis]|uniref:hypothetical protein n=1 Tax=Patulibacter minatonensis TaxID=298163 RepID=UPI0005665BA1|nr:hypothetical protein [Patulibacter minatonensis]
MGPLPYSGWNAVLVAVQALLVALPAAGLPAFAHRFAGRAWSLVLPLSIAVVVGVLAVLPGAAVGLTWLALIATPPLAAAAVGWGARGARPWLAVLAVPALVVAITAEGERAGQAAALAITALSCVTLGRLLVGVVGGVPVPDASAPLPDHGAAQVAGRVRVATGRVLEAVPPLAWIRIALVAMAVIDAVLVFSGGLEKPNDALNAAVPAADLPRLQFVQFGTASMGYGDVFVAGVLGAVLAAEGASRRRQFAAAGATLVLSLLFDLLFEVVDTLPATVPIAVALLLFGGLRGPRDRGAAASAAGPSGAAAPG